MRLPTTPPPLPEDPEMRLRLPSPRMPRERGQALTGVNRMWGSRRKHLEVVAGVTSRPLADTEPEQSWQDEGA